MSKAGMEERKKGGKEERRKGRKEENENGRKEKMNKVREDSRRNRRRTDERNNLKEETKNNANRCQNAARDVQTRSENLEHQSPEVEKSRKMGIGGASVSILTIGRYAGMLFNVENFFI